MQIPSSLFVGLLLQQLVFPSVVVVLPILLTVLMYSRFCVISYSINEHPLSIFEPICHTPGHFEIFSKLIKFFSPTWPELHNFTRQHTRTKEPLAEQLAQNKLSSFATFATQTEMIRDFLTRHLFLLRFRFTLDSALRLIRLPYCSTELFSTTQVCAMFLTIFRRIFPLLQFFRALTALTDYGRSEFFDFLAGILRF